MSLSQDDRTSLDTDGYTAFEREEHRLAVGKLADIRERFLLEAQVAANQVRATGAAYIETHDLATRRATLSSEDAIFDFMSNIEASFDNLVSQSEVRRSRSISEYGSDE